MRRWLERGRGVVPGLTAGRPQAAPVPAPAPAPLRPGTEPVSPSRDLGAADLDALAAVEARLYPFPWTRGNFADALAAGYCLRGRHTADGQLAAYLVAMAGVEEWHLLNISVAPDFQRRGLALGLLDELSALARATASPCIWLEVRPSNARARAVYERYGFAPVGVRRGYYPESGGRREDALVLCHRLKPEAGDALD